MEVNPSPNKTIDDVDNELQQEFVKFKDEVFLYLDLVEKYINQAAELLKMANEEKKFSQY